MKYAGIGSRETPNTICLKMAILANRFAYAGLILRSGRARGADQAFEHGARSAGGICEIYEPRLDLPAQWFDHARLYHPAWNKCSQATKILHARNSAIVLGPKLNDPVEFVVCWTINGQPSGGTGQALRIAADPRYNITVFNLFDDPNATILFKWLDGVK